MSDSAGPVSRRVVSLATTPSHVYVGTATTDNDDGYGGYVLDFQANTFLSATAGGASSQVTASNEYSIPIVPSGGMSVATITGRCTLWMAKDDGSTDMIGYRMDGCDGPNSWSSPDVVNGFGEANVRGVVVVYDDELYMGPYLASIACRTDDHFPCSLGKRFAVSASTTSV